MPIGRRIRQYDRAWLRPDVIAGVTLAAFTIPEAMAYAGLAGLPPQAGMYAALIAPIAYLIFGTSRQLSLGPTSALSIMVASGMSVFAFADPAQYAAATALIVVLASIALMSFTDLAERGVAITGAIPSGLPTPQIPALFDPSLVRLLLSLAFSVFMLSYVEGMSMARTFADKHQHLYHVNRIEFWIALVVLFGMLEGVLIGAIVSLLLLVYRAVLPHASVLGRIPGTGQLSDLERHPGNEEVPGVLVYRLAATLFYANAPVIREQLTQLVTPLKPRPQLVVLDLAGSPGIDLSVVDMLRDLLKADGLAEKFGLSDERQSVQPVIAASMAELNPGH